MQTSHGKGILKFSGSVSLKCCSFLVASCPSVALFCLHLAITDGKVQGQNAADLQGNPCSWSVRMLAVLRASHGTATQSQNTSIKRVLNFSEQWLYVGCINGVLFTLSIHFFISPVPGGAHINQNHSNVSHFDVESAAVPQNSSCHKSVIFLSLVTRTIDRDLVTCHDTHCSYAH